jgi:hypothetical protein
MDPQKATQRMMAAGALLVAGVGLLGVSMVMKKVQGALMGEPRDESAAVAEAPQAEAAPQPGVIHVNPGDPLPPATPLPRPEPRAQPRPPVAAQGEPPPAEGRDPGTMSRGELIDEVTRLRAKVAELSK